MTLHRIEYEYRLPEWDAFEMDLDPDLDPAEKEEIALAEIKSTYDDIESIEIKRVVAIG